MRAFELSSVYLKYKNGVGKELRILPIIHSIKEHTDHTTVTRRYQPAVTREADILISTGVWRACLIRRNAKAIHVNRTQKNYRCGAVRLRLCYG